MTAPGPSTEDAPLVAVPADLDVPGETGRQARVFAIWFVCMAMAILMGIAVRARLDVTQEHTAPGRQEMARARSARLRVAGVMGLLVPALLTWGLTYRYRRGGGHARGIVVDVTTGGELRVWGRGYGQRLVLRGSHVSERFVDVYAGRLGAWRQRRLQVHRKSGARVATTSIELATPALERDLADGLTVSGGEGDCVELAREHYEAVRACVLREVERSEPS